MQGLVNRSVDLQGHRGARGLRPENTLPAFAEALALGVTTLELDVGITRDREVVVTHDAVVSPLKCGDTRPAVPGDPLYPYVGRPLSDLTLAQLKTLECGIRRPMRPETDPFVSSQRRMPGTAMPTLAEVFEMVNAYQAHDVLFNIETKVRPTEPGLTAGPRTFTERVAAVVEAYGMTRRTTLQSFDWRTLGWAARMAPGLGRAALVDVRSFAPSSPWLAGLDLAAFGGDVPAAAEAAGATAVSPEHVIVTPELLASARERRLPVVTWTVNDEDDIGRLVRWGVDGVITDYPDRARVVLEELGSTRRHSQPLRRNPRYSIPHTVAMSRSTIG